MGVQKRRQLEESVMGVEYYRQSRSRVTEVGDQGVFMVGSQRFSLT